MASTVCAYDRHAYVYESNGEAEGLDVDYEYPTNDEQARGYVALLKELRHGLDKHAEKQSCHYKYPLTVSGQERHCCPLLTRSPDCRTLWTPTLQEASCAGNGQISVILEFDVI
jgi:hypothetical protein